jgi:hypothetical protein
MPRSPIDPVSPSSSGRRRSVRLSRRELLAGAGAGAAALVLEQSGLRAQATPRATTVVFSHVTIVNVDAV